MVWIVLAGTASSYRGRRNGGEEDMDGEAGGGAEDEDEGRGEEDGGISVGSGERVRKSTRSPLYFADSR